MHDTQVGGYGLYALAESHGVAASLARGISGIATSAGADLLVESRLSIYRRNGRQIHFLSSIIKLAFNVREIPAALPAIVGTDLFYFIGDVNHLPGRAFMPNLPSDGPVRFLALRLCAPRDLSRDTLLGRWSAAVIGIL